MRIVRVVSLLDFGGVEKRMVNISTAVPSGTQLIFVVLGEGGRAATQIAANGYQVICLGLQVRIPNLMLIVKLCRLFRQIKPDVVHSSGGEANFHAQLAAYVVGVKKRVAEEIGFPAHSAKARIIFRLIYRCANVLVCISRAVAVKVIQLKEIKPVKARVVYNPIVLPAQFPNQTGITDRFIFVTVCRLTAVKNLDSLLKVFACLLRQSTAFQLCIAGDGPEMASLVRLSANLGIQGNVSFTGFVHNPYPVLGNAHVFILPSFSEGLGNAVMEAFVAGLPCIVSGVGGAAELVTEGETGWVVNPCNEQDIYEKMLLAANTNLGVLKDMGKKGRAFITENFSVASHWDALMAVYKQ